MAIKLSSHIPVSVNLGDESEPLKIGVKRLTFQELVELRAKWRQVLTAEGRTPGDGDEFLIPLMQEVFEKYVRIDSQVVVELTDGEETLRKNEGSKLLAVLGGQPGIAMTIFLSVMSQSSLDDKKKSSSPPHTDSLHSSEEPGLEAPGPTPEMIAGNAESVTSAPLEAATPAVSAPSGSMGPTTPTDAPSSSSMSAPSGA